MFINDLADLSIPFDALGLLVVARVYHKHIAVLLNDSIWTTRSDNSTKRCSIFLMFRGGVQFNDTCAGLPPLDLSLPKLPPPAPRSRRAAVSTPKPKPNSKRERSSSSSSRKPNKKRGNYGLRSGSIGFYSRERKERQRNTRNSKKPLLKYDLDSLLSRGRKSKPRSAKPNKKGELKEDDPIYNAFKETHTEQEAEDLLHESDDDQDKDKKSSKVSDEDFETENGKINMKTFARLKNPKAPERHFNCSECDVDGITTVKELTAHIKATHPGFKYQCSMCPLMYDTYNGRTKHENKHFLFKYVCEFCCKRFQFPRRYKDHLYLHTKQGGYKCPTRDCKAVLSTMDNLKIHRKIHDEQKMQCTMCDKELAGSSSLRQHMMGLHGNGTRTFCGKIYQWPGTKNKHQRNCDECLEVIDKEINKARNPRHVEKENRQLKSSESATTSSEA